MTKLTMHYIKNHFVVTGSDISPLQFKSRPEARDSVQDSPSRFTHNGDR